MRRRRNFFRSAPRSRAPTPICGRRLRRVDSVMWHGTHPEQSRLINDAVRNLEDGSTFFKTTSRSADTGRPATRLERQQGPALRTLPQTAANGWYLSNLARSNFRSLIAPLSLSALVVHLFEAVVALIVTPIDEDRSVIDTRAILAPTFKSHMRLGQGSYGRSLP